MRGLAQLHGGAWRVDGSTCGVAAVQWACGGFDGARGAAWVAVRGWCVARGGSTCGGAVCGAGVAEVRVVGPALSTWCGAVRGRGA